MNIYSNEINVKKPLLLKTDNTVVVTIFCITSLNVIVSHMTFNKIIYKDSVMKILCIIQKNRGSIFVSYRDPVPYDEICHDTLEDGISDGVSVISDGVSVSSKPTIPKPFSFSVTNKPYTIAYL